jgi:hypothetical protein
MRLIRNEKRRSIDMSHSIFNILKKKNIYIATCNITFNMRNILHRRAKRPQFNGV